MNKLEVALEQYRTYADLAERSNAEDQALLAE